MRFIYLKLISILTISVLTVTGSDRKRAIVTHDSLTLSAGQYSSILFRVTTDKPPDIPLQYTFRQTGPVPEGMIFESYPCHKPGEKNCVMMAATDGIFLDGVPKHAGKYTLTIHATEAGGEGVSMSFIVIVKAR